MDALSKLSLLISSGGDTKGENGGGAIHLGTVGWEDSDEDHFSPGDVDNDGHTLVQVQLYRGRDTSKPLNPERAQGQKILCHIPDGVYTIPPKGARCYVILPAGMEDVPGAGIIAFTVSPGPEVRRNPTSGDKFISCTGGGQAGIIMKQDGSITLHTTMGNTAEGASVFLRIKPDALQFASPWGTLTFDASGFHLKTKSGPRLDMGGIAIPGVPDLIAGAFTGYCRITAPTFKANASSVYLGAGAVFQPAVFADLNPGLPPPATAAVTGVAKQTQTVWVAP